MKANKIFSILIIFALLAVFVGCASTKAGIPADISEQELFTLAQLAFDDGNLKLSQFYYETLIEKFSDNQTTEISAKYEIAHLLVRKGDKTEAKVLLQDILANYTEETMYSLPPEYKKLAQLELDRLTE